MFNYFVFIILVGFCCLISQGHALGNWDAFDAMLNKNQDSITNRVSPCNSSSEEPWGQESIDWREDENGYHAQLPVRLPAEADAKQLKVKHTDGYLRIDVPKKRLKSII